AEDGIRDGHVTGVQTCALPIYPPWEGTAMVAKIPPLARAALAEQGVPFIDDTAGLTAFLTALRSGWSGPILLAHEQPARRIAHKIGRASCRERGEVTGGGGAIV